MKQRSLVVSVLLTLLVCFGTFAGVLAAHWRPILGLDLRGGLSIVYCPNAHDSETLCALRRGTCGFDWVPFGPQHRQFPTFRRL